VFDNRLVREAEVVLTFGMSGWPVWVHHARREQHWRILEVIKPENAAPSPGPCTTPSSGTRRHN
jgi:hypothetical protein